MKGSHGFWERHRNNQGGKSFLVFLSSAPSLSERRQNEFSAAFPLSGATSPCLSKRVIFESTKSPVVAEHWSRRGLALIWLAGVCSCVHRDPHQSCPGSEQHYGSGGLLSQ